MVKTSRRNLTAADGPMAHARFLLHDRDTKFSEDFAAVFRAAGVEPLKLPPQSPNLNAFAERWVRTVKDECLDQFILFGERSLRHALHEYLAHHQHERNLQGLDNVIPCQNGASHPRGNVLKKQVKPDETSRWRERFSGDERTLTAIMKHRVFLALVCGGALATHAQEGPGFALRFDGAGDNVLINHTNELNAFPLTVTCWLRTTQSTFSPAIVNKLVSGANNGWQVYLLNGNVRARYFADGSNYLSGSTSGLAGGLDGGSVADNVFHHVAFTVNAAGGSLYLDGVLRDSRAWIGTSGAPTTSDLIRLGVGTSSPSSFIGLLDEVTVWNVALTQAEVQDNMHRSLVGTEPGLLAYYRFNEASGSTTADSAPAAGNNQGFVGGPARVLSGVALAPSVTTLSASALTQNSATLNGTANPNNASAAGWFEFGFTTNYGNVTPPQPLGSANAATNFSEALAGLTPGVSYHFRTVASNSFGVAIGADQGFPSLAQRAYLKASNTGPGDGFGRKMAMSGDTLVVGAPFESSNATGVNGDGNNDFASVSGAAYVFVRNGDSWVQQAYLKASNTEIGDFFGTSVAVSGDTLVIGASGEDSNATGVNGDGSNNTGTDSGAAYVFVRSGTNWSQQAYLKASNTGSNDQFGSSVAVSGDTVVVGAPSEDSNATGINGNQSNNTATNSGAVYVFVRSGTNWTQQAYLKASNTDGADFFGASVAASGDTVVVGAAAEDSNATAVNGDGSNNGSPDSGAAYVFFRSGTTWTQQAYLKASNTEGADVFGASVAASGDTVVVGATGEDSNATGVNGDSTNNIAANSGAAYIFVRNGTTWTQQAYLKASNTEIGDNFGTSVAVSGDKVVVGADSEDSNATGVNGDSSNNIAPFAGAAYTFVRAGTNWSFQDYLKASNTEVIPPPGLGDLFGSSVAVSGDIFVVGARIEGSSATGVNGDQNNNNAFQSGAAYAFGPPVPPASDIVVEQSGTNLLSGGSGQQYIVAGSNTLSRNFTIRNIGNGELTGLTLTFGGPDAAMFVVTKSPAAPVAPGSNTLFTVRFAPTSTGTKIATLHLASNDADENPFDVILNGLSLSFTRDSDGDGLNDATEFQLAALGFDFQVPQTSLVNLLFSNLNGAVSNLNAAGLFSQSQIQTLNVDTPLLTKDPNSGFFKLTIGVQKATQLTNFFPFPMTAPQTTINGAGQLEFQFSAPDNAAFFRLESR